MMVNTRVKKIMVILAISLIIATSIFSLGIAYIGGVRGIGLLGICFFLTGGIIVVLAQLIPACIMLSSLIGGIISSLRKGEASIRAA